jgi:hypothetical protein
MLLEKGKNWANGNQLLGQSQPGSEVGKTEHPGGGNGWTCDGDFGCFR